MTKHAKVSVGDVAPDFTLPDQTGTPVRLSDLLGEKTVVLYFYPKDETPGCTIEARAFRDSYEQFRSKDSQVVGVSSDSVRSHRRFARRYNLPFLLLSDADGAVRRLYGVEKTLGLLPGRVTYVIDQTGTVRHVYSSQLRATRHPREALMMLAALAEDRA
jgi:peroxiredoxin Q/BCP